MITCIVIKQKDKIKFQNGSVLTYKACLMWLKKSFNGPPTARSEPGRDQPC